MAHIATIGDAGVERTDLDEIRWCLARCRSRDCLSPREPLAVYSDPCMPVIQESYGFSIRQIDDRDSILAYWRVPGPRNRGHQLGFMDSDSEFMASSTLR